MIEVTQQETQQKIDKNRKLFDIFPTAKTSSFFGVGKLTVRYIISKI